MLRSLFLLFLCQFCGEWLQRYLHIPVPGAILGMLLLLLWMLWRGPQETQLMVTGSWFLRHLALFYIPAGAGLMLYGEVLQRNGGAILVSLIGGTLVAFIVTAKLMQWLLRLSEKRANV